MHQASTTDLPKLQSVLASIGPVAVAVSGGVDSMTLAAVAHQANSRSVIFHAVSAAVPVAGTQRVKNYAEKFDWPLELINAGEMEDPNYRSNPVNRCYYCKSNLYSSITSLTSLPVVSGTNIDDLSDYRPGLSAAKEKHIRHPFVEAGIDKAGVRAIANALGLQDLAELPASPCLSSRVTTGVAINESLLPVIDEVESKIWQQHGKSMALAAVRCRVQEAAIAIQLDTEIEFDRKNSFLNDLKQSVQHIFTQNGYPQFQTISVEPYRRGSAFLIDSIEVE